MVGIEAVRMAALDQTELKEWRLGVSLFHVQGSRQEAHRKDEQAQAHAERKEAQEARQEGQVEPQAPSTAAWAPPFGLFRDAALEIQRKAAIAAMLHLGR